MADRAPDESRRARLLLYALALVIIAVTVAGAAIAWVEWSPFPLIAGLLLSLAGIPWLLSVRSGRFDLFEPAVFKSLFIFMLAIAYIQRLYYEPREYTNLSELSTPFEAGFTTVGVLYIAYFAVLLGAYYLYRPPTISLPQRLSLRGRETVLRRIGLGYIMVGLVGFVYLLWVVTAGNPLLLYTTSVSRSQLFEGLGPVVLIANMTYIGYFLWILATMSRRELPSAAQILTLPVIVGLISLLGGRAAVIRIGIVLAILGYYAALRGFAGYDRSDSTVFRFVQRLHPTTHLLLLPVFWTVASVFLIGAQAAGSDESPINALRSADPLRIVSAGVHNDTFDNMIALMEMVPAEMGYQYGAFYLRVILNFIPRAIWPGKPVSTEGGVIRRWAIPEGSGGLPPGDMGSFYMNAGIPGIIIGAIIYGVLLKLTYWTLYQNRNLLLTLFTFALVMAHLVPYGLVNNALTAFLEDVVLLLPAFAVVFLRKRS
ncbi:hypothetical protein [Halalkalicoccus salilacus]|uniref:hypothetical protein n=1 Tax=Halalkalicoccus salilacus TaxID=3117459 RepID=UPI00300F0162